MPSIFRRSAACTAFALGLLATAHGAETTTTTGVSPTTTSAASPTTTTMPATTTAAPIGALNQIATTSMAHSFIDGKVKLGWTVFNGADTSSATDDVLEVDLETGKDGVYAGFGTAAEKMTGNFFVCWVDAASATPGCADYKGDGYAPTPISAITQIVSSSVVAGGGFKIKVRVPASHLSLATGRVSQRFIVATGAVGQAHGADRTSFYAVPYQGALASETSTTVVAPPTTTTAAATVATTTTTAAAVTSSSSSAAAFAGTAVAAIFALAAFVVA